MIERAVASLESGHLQRAIPKTRRAARRSRQLHTGFWQHGASALELSSFWPFSPGESSSSEKAAAAPVASGLLEPKLVATSFLLDFLYPSESQSFLHRVLAPRPKSDRLRPLRRRQYSAQHMASFQRTEPSILCTTRFESVAQKSSDTAARYQSIAAAKAEAIGSVPTDKSAEFLAVQKNTQTAKPTKSKAPADTFVGQFRSRVSNTSPVLDDAWSRYQKASREEQEMQRPGLIIAFARTDDYLECSRATSLFRELPQEEWSDVLLSSAVRSLAACGKFESALRKFKEGLQHNYVGGMQYIVASAFTARKWQELFQVWFEYSSLIEEHIDKSIPFDHLQHVPKLDTLFAAFEKHIKYTGLAQIRAENKGIYSRQMFDKLRHLMIRSVLAKPCLPSRAMDILSRYAKTDYYELYIESVLQSAQAGKQAKSTMRHLSKIYNDYRQRPDAQFTADILRGMFNVYNPNNPAGLALLYEDWTKLDGGMDEWAYENFLAFYARSGDVPAVRDLWQRYMTVFPDAGKNARGFYSLLNAYAQCGDVDGAKTEISIMKESGIQTDAVIDNALLKCHIRAGNYKEATACFTAIGEQHGPNLEAFEHMMELHSANGDLEKTLALFNQAQTALLRPSEGMATSLVVAYLHNGLIQEAEQICREMARRGITCREIWNSLIQAYATAGKLDKCFQLLPAMQNNNLAWDHDTCQAVLVAQGRAKQTASAHRLLRSAVADNLLPITADHFAIVMNSAIGTKQAPLVDILTTEMERAGIQPNFATHLARFESGFVRAPTANRTTRLAKDLVQYMRKLVHNADAPPGQRKASPYTAAVRDVTELNRELRDVGDALRLLIDKREMALAEDLVTLYANMRPLSERGQHMPPDVLGVIMGAYRADGRPERVLQLWAVILGDMRRRAENPATKRIFPAYAYHLSGPMAHVAQVYRDTAGDGRRLLAYTQAALDAGFRFTRDTWNTLICCLAALGQWEPAMHWCETLLMPRWRGWAAAAAPHRRLPLAARHELTDARPAVLSLQREWLRLRTLAAWSAGVTAKLQRVEAQYPLLHQAFTTVDVVDLPDTWVASIAGAGEKRTSLNKAIIQDALGAMPLQDLLAMRLTLGAQLHVKKEKRGRAWAKKWGRVYVPPKGKWRRF
ncbi:translation regulator (Cya5), putative [Cordyceps militaris CM01]|uniref:Translation regulator (Cya5), putative n=1 Tax=Cordyceps militaris (strain CM01) TaxID=983644 RepID=G3J9P6_CORMM|nr:translation regulator (Cya5), putative [Cordyceps militaris CM01]EGX94172.1 translation regulator (Cya5), putative [Cordyceps militaris CM01]